jgi:hypothetical protein
MFAMTRTPMETKLALAAAALALTTLSQATPVAPTATLSRSFVEYPGSGPVGRNGAQDNDNFYWMYESSGIYMGQAVHSWWLMWDPADAAAVSGSVTFDSAILFVHDEKAELLDTVSFQEPGVSYDYSAAAVGLEETDRARTSFSADTLSLRWGASSPGDHVRVMTAAPTDVPTAVPEPDTHGLLLVGLIAIGLSAARRASRGGDGR